MPRLTKEDLILVPAAQVRPGQERRWVISPDRSEYELQHALNGGMHLQDDHLPIKAASDPRYAGWQAWVKVEVRNKACPCGICQGLV